ncbi:uncharacterized protein BX663DRAFT_438168 [Cokeromyces recurvatus]|uniref:uncharacterized protein n=1 Tax=Cokeromyces recurvatus TaxID=90255 RepID=UPI0022203F99|nr:uncharacterized protein BX663DRAFT_438168 [Cokeromyces recurvatus]KAI7900924.1 hypothetical protein BX663DRAFT_438168 [Cokeromyces recurvatus]
MLKSLVLIWLSFSFAWASSISLTSPKPNDVWEAGSTVQIKWNVNDEDTKPIRLQYASGPSKALVINGLIADNVDASLGHYSWKIPKSLKPKK